MRWQITTELTYEIAPGDTPAEHGQAAELDRAKAKLSELLDGKPFVHYHLVQLPRKVYEAD